MEYIVFLIHYINCTLKQNGIHLPKHYNSNHFVHLLEWYWGAPIYHIQCLTYERNIPLILHTMTVIISLYIWVLLCSPVTKSLSRTPHSLKHMCIYRFDLFYVYLSVWPILCVCIGLAYYMCMYRFGLFYVYVSVWSILCVFIGLAYSTVNNAHICWQTQI